jgi:hypothetical protein
MWFLVLIGVWSFVLIEVSAWVEVLLSPIWPISAVVGLLAVDTAGSRP